MLLIFLYIQIHSKLPNTVVHLHRFIEEIYWRDVTLKPSVANKNILPNNKASASNLFLHSLQAKSITWWSRSKSGTKMSILFGHLGGQGHTGNRYALTTQVFDWNFDQAWIHHVPWPHITDPSIIWFHLVYITSKTCVNSCN